MAKQVCIICKRFVTEDHCPLHPEAKLVTTWKGRVVIIDPGKSEIAKKMNIVEKGEYAIRI